MRRFIPCLLLLAAACGEKAANSPATKADSATSADSSAAAADSSASADSAAPLTRPILQWTGATAHDANAAKLPPDWKAVEQTRCAKDPTRQYIGEIFKFGLKDIQVQYHWAPVIPSADPKRPTLGQPEFAYAGTVQDVNDSTDDVLADHPFGPDRNANVLMDQEFIYLSNGKDAAGELHCEVELQEFNNTAFGYKPAAGDRALMQGAWVLDCGHPPYGTELHPPTFLAYARPSGDKATSSLMFVAPFRSSLLFNPSLALATDVTNTARFDDPATQAFPLALMAAVVDALNSGADHITAHSMMIANKFNKLQWDVCAPLPRPAGAKLDATWHFTARSGVTVAGQADEAQGCVHFTAEMAADYVPAKPIWADAPWTWQKLSDSAGGQLGQSVDVRKEVMKIAKSLGLDPDNAPALKEDHPPRIDAYPMLQPRAGADKDGPIGVDSKADDQPYPFYGRATVSWK